MIRITGIVETVSQPGYSKKPAHRHACYARCCRSSQSTAHRGTQVRHYSFFADKKKSNPWAKHACRFSFPSSTFKAQYTKSTSAPSLIRWQWHRCCMELLHSCKLDEPYDKMTCVKGFILGGLEMFTHPYSSTLRCLQLIVLVISTLLFSLRFY